MKTNVNQFPGKLLALFVGMYGVHVYSQLILFDTKGFLLSTFSAIWLLILFFFTFSNIFQQILGAASFSWSKGTLLFFIAYAILNSLFSSAFTGSTFSMEFVLSVILPGFLLGCLSNADYSRFFLTRRVLNKIERENIKKKYFKLALVLSFLFILYQISLYKIDFSSVIFSTNNSLYQSLGDYYIIFYCGLLALRENSIKLNSSFRFTFVFNLIVIIEILISVFFLQLIGSNKGSLAIVTIGFFYLYYNGAGSLISRFQQAFTLLLIFICGYFLLTTFFDFELVSGLRYFREAQDESILNNSSLTSRMNQWSEEREIFGRNLIFGDINDKLYIHSTIATIQTHTGLIGSFLFWTFMVMQFYYIYFKSENVLAKSIAAPLLLVSIISSAFWWLPLWFLIGFLFIRKAASLA